MKIRFISLTSAIIAMSVGIVVLLGYFIPNVPLLQDTRWLLVSWASTLAAAAVWIGVLNLLSVHWKKFNSQSSGWVYSLFVILSLIVVIGAGLVGLVLEPGKGASNAINVWIFHYIQSAVGAALAGLIVFFLIFAGYRLLRRPPSLILVVFLIAAVLSLISLAPLPDGLPDLGPLRDLWGWVTRVPAVAGARGLLLGIGLGIVATGLRILLALDRPYGE
jgi:hypothetical protein